MTCVNSKAIARDFGRSPRVRQRLTRTYPILVFLTFTIALAAHPARASEWLDVEDRIQYSYYTEDARALSEIADQLGRATGPDEPLRDYYIGLANYRLALVLAGRDRDRARQAIEACGRRLEAALKRQPDFAPGLALHSACLRTAAVLKPWNPLAGAKSAEQMARAARLAPRDPRVLLLQALEKGERSRIDDASLAKLKQAAEAFEAERQGVERTPGWGAAEAYAHLGRGYLERGDILAARDALERALLIAPDFAMAWRVLTQITSG